MTALSRRLRPATNVRESRSHAGIALAGLRKERLADERGRGAEDRLKMYYRNVSSRSISASIAEPWKVLARGVAGRPAQGRHAFYGGAFREADGCRVSPRQISRPISRALGHPLIPTTLFQSTRCRDHDQRSPPS